MPTRNVVLTDHYEEFIRELVGSGRYKNASEVLREALRVMERREQTDLAKIEALRKRFDEAEQDIREGRVDDYTPTLLDEIDAEERAEYDQAS